MENPLPKFDRPPVTEVALSVQFEKLNVTTAQLALVWQKFRGRFPVVEEKPPIDTVIEQFGPAKAVDGEIRFEVANLPSPRLWFVSESQRELVQIQRNRFVRNWRKTENEIAYPSYEKLRESFVTDWELFLNFVATEFDSTITPNQCEVTYVNIFEDIATSDVPQVVSVFSGKRSDDYLGDTEDLEFRIRFILNEEDGKPWGRLHISAKPVIRMADGSKSIRMSLTVRGAPKEKNSASVLEFLDRGHEAVVRGFASITTEEMHKKWERTS